jgi:hypothetical protein
MDDGQRHDGNIGRCGIEDVKPDLIDVVVAINEHEGEFNGTVNVADLIVGLELIIRGYTKSATMFTATATEMRVMRGFSRTELMLKKQWRKSLKNQVCAISMTMTIPSPPNMIPHPAPRYDD